MKTISIYVRNKEITPSSYYRIIQYAKHFDGTVNIRDIAPKKLYEKNLNFNKKNKIGRFLLSIVYYVVMVSRVSYYLLLDLRNKPQYIIVSKTFCPRYTPVFLRVLLEKVTNSSTLYWDFDDYIFESGEISKAQASILESKSKNIIVTNDYLKSKINPQNQDKVILMPTTDGDMQDFDAVKLLSKRKSTFNNRINLVWVATSVNIPNLEKILKALDKAAFKLKKIFNKELVLTVVCNKPIEKEMEYLKIKNVKWTRDRAKEEIYNAHIGIMPLIYKEYALGKGGFKLVQYISTSLPVIASNVGFNQEVVDPSLGILLDDNSSNDGWIDAVIKISTSMEIWESYSENAYKRWLDKFSYMQNLNTWKELLQR